MKGQTPRQGKPVLLSRRLSLIVNYLAGRIITLLEQCRETFSSTAVRPAPPCNSDRPPRNRPLLPQWHHPSLAPDAHSWRTRQLTASPSDWPQFPAAANRTSAQPFPVTGWNDLPSRR